MNLLIALAIYLSLRVAILHVDLVREMNRTAELQKRLIYARRRCSQYQAFIRKRNPHVTELDIPANELRRH